MKKSFCFMKIVSALFALALFASCDSGGGGGGGGGGGNSAQTSKTNITITIPSATSSSSDINLLGDFSPVYATENFRYVIYYKKNSTTSEKKSAKTGDKVTFNDVKYDTYDFVLEIYVDENKNENTLLDTITKTETVSASNNTVTFPDMSTSKYSEWFFVSTTDQLTDALDKILPETSSFSASKKAKICLKGSIEYNDAESVKNNDKIKIIDNGFSFAARLYTVTLPSDLPEGCFVTTSSADNKFAENGTVTLTVTAGTGYKFKSISYRAAGSASQNDPNVFEAGVTYTFLMPANDVSVSAMFIPVYTITYDLNGGTASDFEETVEYTEENFDDDGVYALPTRDKISKTGYLFYGWYTDSEFLGSKVTGIDVSDRGNKIFYARWVDSIYIMPTTNDENSDANDGLSEDTPVNALSKVIAKINAAAEETEVEDFDWKIRVGWDLQKSVLDGLSGVKARSLTIMGSAEMNTKIDASSDTAGAALILKNLSVPVTIRHLKITGGKIGYNASGAGIYIGNCLEGVTLGEGCEVSGNTAFIDSSFSSGSVCGIGIYVGTASLTLTDNAKVTNNNIDSSETLSSLYHVYYGGGIYASSDSTVTISGSAEVTGNNSSPGYGKGIHLRGNGNGEEKLFLKDSAKVDEIYLDGGNGFGGVPSDLPKINVSGIASDSVKICGRPLGFVSDYMLLTGDGVGGNYTKFAVTGAYKIGNTGMLVLKDVNEFALEDLNSFTYSNSLPTVGSANNIAAYYDKILVFEYTSAGVTEYTVVKITGYDSTDGFTGVSVKYNSDGTSTSNSITDKQYIDILTGSGEDDNESLTTYLKPLKTAGPHYLSLIGSCNSTLLP